MKTCLVVAFAALFVTPTIRADDTPKREPKPRFKGVELYSWKDEKKGWLFVLVDGTNRTKTEKEIKSVPTVYAGTDKLADALKVLAEGDMVFWSRRVKGFEYPPEDDLKKIDGAAKAAKVELHRVGE
ncbi:MAG: hypothetical protein JWO38_1501 [Gemmataceae bacterium]|nr:hypothetical protein [Gemmataceae bacterium]